MSDSPPAPEGGVPNAAFGFSARTAAFLVVSSTIGGGILGSAGYVALDAGGHTGAILVWAVGGLIAACGALSLAEVSASLPRSGGEFVILSEAYGPLIGFLGGWVSLVFGFVAPIAATGSLAATYLLVPLSRLVSIGPSNLLATRLTATVAIGLFAFAHSASRSRTERVQGYSTSSTIAVLALFVTAGLAMGWRRFPTLGATEGIAVGGFFVGLIRVSYAYTGWNAASYVAGEIADSQRILPRAVIAGTGIVIALYLGIVVAIGLALPMPGLKEIAATQREDLDRVGELAAAQLFGEQGALAMSLIMGIVLLASLSALLLTGPRVAVAMAHRGRLPSFLGRHAAQGESPAIAISAVALASLAILWTGGFEAITFAAGVGLALNSLLTVAAVFVLRWRRPEWPRPFRTPAYPFVPLLYLGLTAIALGVTCFDREKRGEMLAGIGGVLAGVPIFFLTGLARPKADETILPG